MSVNDERPTGKKTQLVSGTTGEKHVIKIIIIFRYLGGTKVTGNIDITKKLKTKITTLTHNSKIIYSFKKDETI